MAAPKQFFHFQRISFDRSEDGGYIVKDEYYSAVNEAAVMRFLWHQEMDMVT